MEFIKKWGLSILVALNLIASVAVLYTVVQLWTNSVALSTKIDLLDKTYPDIRMVYLNLVSSRNILMGAGIVLFITALTCLVLLYLKTHKQKEITQKD